MDGASDARSLRVSYRDSDLSFLSWTLSSASTLASKISVRAGSFDVRIHPLSLLCAHTPSTLSLHRHLLPLLDLVPSSILCISILSERDWLIERPLSLLVSSTSGHTTSRLRVVPLSYRRTCHGDVLESECVKWRQWDGGGPEICNLARACLPAGDVKVDRAIRRRDEISIHLLIYPNISTRQGTP